MFRNIRVSYDRPLLKEYITSFVIDVSHLSGEIFTLKRINSDTEENNFSHKKKKQVFCRIFEISYRNERPS